MIPSAGEGADAVRRRDRSPVELVEESLAEIERWQPVTNAFSQMRDAEARAEARALADGLARGEAAGPIAGVPIAVKDLFDVEGLETTGCCAGYRGRMARADAEAVSRLRAAGAIVVGKTNQHELAAGATNAVSDCGPTMNPWDPGRITGGSSGGSAAAVAARIVPLALGTDTGGSIRIPSSFCGTSGLKPATDRVSLSGGMALAPSLDTAGPIAATVEDVSLAYSVLVGEELGGGDLDGITVGVAGGYFAKRVAPESLAAADAVGRTLGDAGFRVREASVEGIDDAPDVWTAIAWHEFAREHGHLLSVEDAVLPATRRILEFGAGVTDEEYGRAVARAAEIRSAFLATLEEVDVLLTPATPFPAPPVGADVVQVADGEAHDMYRGGPSWFTRPVNLAGVPALSVPAGFSSEGVPLGVQLIGRDEGVLLRIGRAYQERTDHHLRAPSVP